MKKFLVSWCLGVVVVQCDRLNDEQTLHRAPTSSCNHTHAHEACRRQHHRRRLRYDCQESANFTARKFRSVNIEVRIPAVDTGNEGCFGAGHRAANGIDEGRIP